MVLTPAERMDLEFFTRISADHAKWFVTRRNEALFKTDTQIKAFMTELSIPFPIRHNTMFWTIVYFARRLIFPQNDQIIEHLKQWCQRTSAKCTHNRTNPLVPKVIELNGKKYIMPIELWWTPTVIPRETFPNVQGAEDDTDNEDW